MSGHSRWSQIKRQKGVADKKRGTLFTRLAKKITLAAREMGGDPNMNFKLRLAIEKAREANMPKDNIDRAIKSGTGELGGENIEEVMYEAFGPEGSAFLLEAVTNNKNRTAGDIRTTFGKFGGNLASTNSVQWMFERKGVIRIARESIHDQEKIELAAIEAGADDIMNEEEGITIFTKPEDLNTVKAALEKSGLSLASAELEYISKEKLKNLDSSTAEKLEHLTEALDELDDIIEYHTNF